VKLWVGAGVQAAQHHALLQRRVQQAVLWRRARQRRQPPVGWPETGMQQELLASQTCNVPRHECLQAGGGGTGGGRAGLCGQRSTRCAGAAGAVQPAVECTRRVCLRWPVAPVLEVQACWWRGGVAGPLGPAQLAARARGRALLQCAVCLLGGRRTPARQTVSRQAVRAGELTPSSEVWLLSQQSYRLVMLACRGRGCVVEDLLWAVLAGAHCRREGGSPCLLAAYAACGG